MKLPQNSKPGEIVAAKIGTIITNDRHKISEALRNNTPIEWLCRNRMQFMAGLDLGEKWERLAAGPTLFCLDAEGNPLPATAGQ